MDTNMEDEFAICKRKFFSPSFLTFSKVDQMLDQIQAESGELETLPKTLFEKRPNLLVSFYKLFQIAYDVRVECINVVRKE